MPDQSLSLNDFFYSIQGESTLVGLPTAFIRLQGCNLRCRYCDTQPAQETEAGIRFPLEEIVHRTESAGVEHVCITGGEPLLQRKTLAILCRRLVQKGFVVSVETNGSLAITGLPAEVKKIVDIKAPGSGMVQWNRWDNMGLLGAEDEIKCVIGDRVDFDWAVSVVRRYGLANRLPVLFSPVRNILTPARLAQWIIEAGLPVRLQLQLHRIIWPAGEEPLVRHELLDDRIPGKGTLSDE